MLINLGNKLIGKHKAECHCKHIYYVGFGLNLVHEVLQVKREELPPVKL